MDDTRDAIAAHYAPSVEAYRRYWAPALGRLAAPLFGYLPRPVPGGSALDLGCGVGTALALLTELAGPGGRIVAADLTPEMLRAARSLPGANPILLDGAKLPFRDTAFDLVVSLFVLHHVREQRRTLAEILRVLVHRGKLGLAVWGDHDPGNAAFDLFDELLDRFGAPPDPRPVPAWREEVSEPDRLAGLLNGAGFSTDTIWTEDVEYVWTADDFLGYRMGLGGTGRRLERLSSARKAEFEAEARGRFARLERDQLGWKPRILFAVASRPPPEGTLHAAPALS